jgi:hypothetical protein
MPFNFFKAKVKSTHGGKEHVLYGTSEPKWGQSVEGQIKHIALVRGMGTVDILKHKTYPTGEAWYKAQYGKKKKPVTKTKRKK